MAHKIVNLRDGSFRLDGGAMFGVVPRNLWEKCNPPDDQNRILLGLNCLLVEGDGFLALIDTGNGAKGDDDFRKIYGMENTGKLAEALRAHGRRPEEISHVINTHLHFDHCGGNTILEGGSVLPAFPQARYIVQKQEWLDACKPSERSRASYLADDFLPLKEAGQLDLVEGEGEVLPGIRLIPTPGHTRGHQSLLVEAEEGPVFYAADLFPTSSHLPLPWIMSYDLYPLETLETKRQILIRARDEGWLFFFEHEADENALGKIEWVKTKKGEKPVFRPLPRV
ncbi:MAG: MBL fold metallo-hydrolase [Candidatus Krumholzibacteria bacterium]|jgi:glyoxylase-like metal-dependent hydrolase (beta-lactamase superfamily II)|nr:MBL fold metallo-hydrolase [Candidatus Krumholzibacteria bacterium]